MNGLFNDAKKTSEIIFTFVERYKNVIWQAYKVLPRINLVMGHLRKFPRK